MDVGNQIQARLWLLKLGGDISIWWAYSVPPGYDRVEVEAKTWWGPVTARTYLQPHYGNGVFSNVYLSAGQH